MTMLYRSTRGSSPAVNFSDALERGLAPDGGLYVPERLPSIDVEEFSDLKAIEDIAERLLTPFLDGDPLAPELKKIGTEALSFPIPITPLAQGPAQVLELFWGPTAAFKDIGARFLAECLQRIDGPARTVLVATSGDTGGAVASAFWRKPGIEVGILFPKDGVSVRQRHQLTCFGENVSAFAVSGTFDDCQKLLKQALADEEWRTGRGLTTANSINVARLLPQIVYYAAAALHHHRQSGTVPGFIVPSGNVGNATAALWAKAMGFPVGRIVMVTNANRTVPDYLQTGSWSPRPSVKTLANAMDVGDPSNMERVFDLYPDIEDLRRDVESMSVDDAEIEETIRHGRERYGRVWDPHTATAVRASEILDGDHWVLVSTAHPAKFDDVVEPLIGEGVEVPPALAELLARESRFVEIEPELAALARAW